VEIRKRPSSEEGNEAQKQLHGEEVGSSRAVSASREDVKRKSAKCPHSRKRSGCKQCGGSTICEHNSERKAASNAAGRASASTTAKKAGASNATGRASTMQKVEHLRAQPRTKQVQANAAGRASASTTP
jgi:hypothetical protein